MDLSFQCDCKILFTNTSEGPKTFSLNTNNPRGPLRLPLILVQTLSTYLHLLHPSDRNYNSY